MTAAAGLIRETPVRIKIISNGMPDVGSTKVIDAETGETVRNVRVVSFHHEAGKMATVTLEFSQVPVELEGRLTQWARQLVDVTPVDSECRCFAFPDVK